MPVSCVRDPPRPGVILDDLDGGQRDRHRILVDPEVGPGEPSLLFQMRLQIVQKHRKQGSKLGGVR